MRLQVLCLSAAALLFSASAALADTEVPQTLVVPGDTGHNFQSDPGPRIPERAYRYQMRMETLREKVIRLKAEDGGQLSSDHAVSLQRQLDNLNRIYRNG